MKAETAVDIIGLKAEAFDLIKQAEIHQLTIQQNQEAIQRLQERVNVINAEIDSTLEKKE